MSTTPARIIRVRYISSRPRIFRFPLPVSGKSIIVSVIHIYIHIHKYPRNHKCILYGIGFYTITGSKNYSIIFSDIN